MCGGMGLTLYALAMLAGLVLLLRAERRTGWRTGPFTAEVSGAGWVITAPYAMAPAPTDLWARSSRRYSLTSKGDLES